MIALSDIELEQVMSAARGQGSRSVSPLAAELAKYPEIGLGSCARSPVVT
jgi:hypothetical protein